MNTRSIYGTGGSANAILADKGKSYPDFLDDMGKLLQSALPRTDRERDELFEAEAECRRLRSQLAVAEERRELAQTRYDRERLVLREMFDTWKAEVMSLNDEMAGDGGSAEEADAEAEAEAHAAYHREDETLEGETPVRLIPELDTATLDA